MAHGDKTKIVAFQMWLAGQPLAQIQQSIKRMSTTKPSSVKGWINDWERGKQKMWTPKVS